MLMCVSGGSSKGTVLGLLVFASVFSTEMGERRAGQGSRISFFRDWGALGQECAC